MSLKSWRIKTMAGFVGALLAVTLLPGEAQAGTYIYMNGANAVYTRMYYNFGELTLTGGKSTVSGTGWTPWIHTLTPNLATYASAAGSGQTAVLRHAASANKRSGCRWTYPPGTPPVSTRPMSCWYYTP